VSLLLAGLVVVGTSGAMMVGRWLSKRSGTEAASETKEARDEGDEDARASKKKEQRREADGTTDEQEAKKNERAKTLAAHPSAQLDGFVCQLGDVVMRITGEEAWLAGGVVLSEQIPVAVLFIAPEAGRDTMIYARARPSSSLVWLEPLDPTAILVGGEPPSSVEHKGVRFDRTRRLPLRPRRIGVGAPDMGDAVIVAEYASAGAERLLLLKANSGLVQAYRGLELDEGAFEVIASGEATLDR
jgi:hypothetical protein